MTAFLHISPTQEKEPKVSLDAIGSCVVVQSCFAKNGMPSRGPHCDVWSWCVADSTW